MIAQAAPLLLHLTSSFLISTLRLVVEPEDYASLVDQESSIQTPFILISPNRNISVSLRGRTILADGLPLISTGSSQIFEPSDGNGITITARCQHSFAFRLSVGEFERTIASPSFCANHGMNGELF
jgi:hypothetical protein